MSTRSIRSAVPANTAPTVSGAATLGSTLTLDSGTWAGTRAPTFGIYWLRYTGPIASEFTTVPAGSTAISGANASTYLVVAADHGEYPTAQVAGSNSSGFGLAGAVSTAGTQWSFAQQRKSSASRP